ncbi:MFS transporter [Streptomyces sp. NPDC048196]|uniref:MFS transporter n=1 Tax=Streptomyces sp. NPDC048196 TaxID=3154712 RepID=UPI0033E37B51
MSGRHGDASSGPGHTSSKRNLRPLGGLLAAMAVSLTGTRISAIALPWFVLVTTGSATQTGLVAFCEMTPYVLVKALAGPLIDRAGPRTVSWTTDLASATAAAAVPLLHALDLLSLPLLLGLVALIGSARGPGDLAKEVMVPQAAEHSRIPLERATGLTGVTERLAATIGPAAGGSLVALFSPLMGLALNAACFTLGSLIIALALPRGIGLAVDNAPPTHENSQAGASQAGFPQAQGSQARDLQAEEPQTEDSRPGYWRRFGEGFAFLRSQPLLLTIIVMVSITNLLDSAFTTVLLPVWARESGNGPAVIGLNSSVGGAAAIVGSLVAATIAHRMRRRIVFFAGFLLAGPPRFLVLASHAPTWVVLTVFAVGGFGAGFLNPILGAISFERVPRHLLGRVSALGDALAWAGIPFGGLIAGAAATSIGLVPALLIGGVAYFLTTTLTALRPEWREMDRSRRQHNPPDTLPDYCEGSQKSCGSPP